MTDLLNQARQGSGNQRKKMWTMEQTLALVVLKGRGKTTKQIAELVDHPENSVTYRFNRWCGKFDNFAQLLDHYQIGDKSIEQIEQIVDNFLTAE